MPEKSKSHKRSKSSSKKCNYKKQQFKGCKSPIRMKRVMPRKVTERALLRAKCAFQNSGRSPAFYWYCRGATLARRDAKLRKYPFKLKKGSKADKAAKHYACKLIKERDQRMKDLHKKKSKK